MLSIGPHPLRAALRACRQFQVKIAPGYLQLVRGTNGLKLPQGERIEGAHT